MDEGDIIRKIRNSIKAKQSKTEIRKKLQNSGYKLDYIDVLIGKAERGKKIMNGVIFATILLVLISFSAYMFFSNEYGNKTTDNSTYILQYRNINTESKISTQGEGAEKSEFSEGAELIIDTETVKYILNAMGITKELHANPLGFERPYIGFDISGKRFYSVINKGAETFIGQNDKEDLIFSTTNEEVQKILESEDPNALAESLKSGNIEIELMANRAELFAKGYLGLYEKFEL